MIKGGSIQERGFKARGTRSVEVMFSGFMFSGTAERIYGEIDRGCEKKDLY